MHVSTGNKCYMKKCNSMYKYSTFVYSEGENTYSITHS